MNSKRPVLWSLLLSMVLHVVVVALGATTVAVTARDQLQADSVALSDSAFSDSWVGETFDIDTLVSEAAAEIVVQKEPGSEISGSEETKEAKEDGNDTHLPQPPAPSSEREVRLEGEGASVTEKERDLEQPAPAGSQPIPAGNQPAPAASQPAPAASGAPSGLDGRAGLGGPFGAAGRPGGVRNLATAFTRAIPIASSGDPAWLTLPLGPAGSLEVVVEVGEDRKIVRATPTHPSHAPEHLVRLVERTLVLLRAGRFSLSSADTTAGIETFQLEAAIDQVEITPHQDPSTAGPYSLGFQAPRKGEPGHATFTLQSGRRVFISISFMNP